MLLAESIESFPRFLKAKARSEFRELGNGIRWNRTCDQRHSLIGRQRREPGRQALFLIAWTPRVFSRCELYNNTYLHAPHCGHRMQAAGRHGQKSGLNRNLNSPRYSMTNKERFDESNHRILPPLGQECHTYDESRGCVTHQHRHDRPPIGQCDWSAETNNPAVVGLKALGVRPELLQMHCHGIAIPPKNEFDCAWRRQRCDATRGQFSTQSSTTPVGMLSTQRQQGVDDGVGCLSRIGFGPPAPLFQPFLPRQSKPPQPLVARLSTNAKAGAKRPEGHLTFFSQLNEFAPHSMRLFLSQPDVSS